MFSLPPLPFTPDSLEPYIDTATMEIHHGKHHAAYVKNLNDLLPDKSESDLQEILKNLDKLPEAIRSPVRNHGGGHANHSLFWQLLTPKSSLPGGKLLEAINSVFTNLDGFQEKFTSAALGRFGSGWAWLVVKNGKLEIMDTPKQDTPSSLSFTPILALDVWEHAYYLKYQNRRAEYVAAWWHVVNWAEVNRLFLTA